MAKSDESSVHSLRCSDEVWERARRRSLIEGVTMNYVLSAILEGYASSRMDLPKVEVVKRYNPTR